MPVTREQIRDLSSSRLWAGVPQINLDSIREYDPAFTGHTFIFVTHMPVFMENDTKGQGNIHAQNLKALIERASTGFSGPANKVVNFQTQTDGYSDRTLPVAVSVTKDIDEITLKLHEFKGLILKNALEWWIDGIMDVKSKHANYHGQVENLGYSIKNHTGGVLVVQTDPSWYRIQDAAWYHNMTPTQVNYEYFNYTKGENNIVEDQDVSFKCNEERSDIIMDAAVSYIRTKIISNLDAWYNYQKYDPRIPTPQ